MYYGKLTKEKLCVGKTLISKETLDLISIDFVVELPVSSSNNKHILTIVDNFAKHFKVYSVPDRTPKTAAKCMYDYVLTFGIPLKLYSDCDPAYEAEFLKLYTNFVGIEWDQWLREVCYAYNSSVNSSTGFTPAELMFGRNLRVSMDILYSLSLNDHATLFTMKEFRDKFSQMYELAADNVNQRQIKSNSYYDAKVHDDKLEINTLVYIYLPRKQRMKLDLKWDGPYKVINAKHPVYEIEKSKWLTRDKLHRCEKGAVYPKIDSIKSDEHKTDKNREVMESEETDSDSSIEENLDVENVVRQNNRYGFRQNINLPNRYRLSD